MLDYKGLRFAPLIRVSTEKQEKRGESLNTQRTDLDADIKSMGGTIFKWYSGQEHATPNSERKILDALLEDAKLKKFDAVIICYLDRWSRDNKRSAEDLDILIQNDIRFFVRQQEYNLRNEQDYFMVSLQSLIGRTVIHRQTSNSMKSRIARAKQGIPVAGKLPYGRTYDKKTNKWSIDKKKKSIMEHAAKRYLSGESMDTIAAFYNMNTSNLHKLLKERCGDEWTIKLRCKQDKVDEAVTIKIPRLLPESIIKEIQKRSNSNKTFNHGSYKYQYLLSGIIFDSATGHALTGTPNARGQRYYRPFKGRVAHRYMINADVIETAFVEGFNDLICHQDKWKSAVFDGDTIEERVAKLKKDLEIVNKDITAKKKKMDSIEKRIMNCTDDVYESMLEKFKGTMKKLIQDINQFEFERDTINNQIKTLPTLEEAEDKRKKLLTGLLKQTKESYERSGRVFESLSFDEKKKLINELFGGVDEKGKKYGLYVTVTKATRRTYQFDAYGRLGNILGFVKARSGEYDSSSLSSKSNTKSSWH